MKLAVLLTFIALGLSLIATLIAFWHEARTGRALRKKQMRLLAEFLKKERS